MKTLPLLFLLAIFAAGETKVYLHTGTQATRSEGSPRGFGGMESHPVDYLPQILKSWTKVKECNGVTPIVIPEGADYAATLNFDEIGLVPRTTYMIADKSGKILASKSVTSPKNVAKDICKAVTK
jgi:hypothetical protein